MPRFRGDLGICLGDVFMNVHPGFLHFSIIWSPCHNEVEFTPSFASNFQLDLKLSRCIARRPGHGALLQSA